MDPDKVTALRSKNSAATAAALIATAAAVVLAATVAAAQDKIEAEVSRNIIIVDLATLNNLSAQVTSTRSTNTNLTIPTFCLTPEQISPDLILKYSNKTDITIYEKAITPFKLTFDGSLSSIKIFMDNIMQRANDTGWDKVQGDIIHFPVDGTPMIVVTRYGCISTGKVRAHDTSWMNRECRKFQNNQMMVKVVLDSISKKVRKEVTNQEGVISVGTPLIRTGNLILKLIMKKLSLTHEPHQ